MLIAYFTDSMEPESIEITNSASKYKNSMEDRFIGYGFRKISGARLDEYESRKGQWGEVAALDHVYLIYRLLGYDFDRNKFQYKVRLPIIYEIFLLDENAERYEAFDHLEPEIWKMIDDKERRDAGLPESYRRLMLVIKNIENQFTSHQPVKSILGL